uniref:Osmotin-like protein n=1 Tax=Aegilops tauschii subsp. strangulata TaxID=200361 RepID=A0A453HTV6_AEGTS
SSWCSPCSLPWRRPPRTRRRTLPSTTCARTPCGRSSLRTSASPPSPTWTTPPAASTGAERGSSPCRSLPARGPAASWRAPAAAVTRCDTGMPPAPVTVAQVSVHGSGGLAEYSVSLVDGFNLPVMVTPHGFEQGRQCPSLGCAVDLDVDCPRDARAPAGGCRAQGQGHFFKERCPDTRTTPTDVEATPQRCIQPGELKIVFCPDSSY